MPSAKPRFHHPRLLRLATALSVALLTASTAGTALADAADAHIPPPQDTPYPGTIKIDVDATNTTQGIFEIHETIPVQPGELTLLYPKWIPGNHAFNPNALDKFAGLVITANGKRIPWLRDKYDVYAFKVEVPQGVSNIDVSFQWLAARTHDQGSNLMTHLMLDLKWDHMTLYPAGHYSRDITVVPSVKFPAGWQFGTGLETASHSGDSYTFKPTTYNTLVDSPIYAGKYFKRLDLNPGAKAPVHMDLVAQAPDDLKVKPEELKMLRTLVQQEYKLFDSHHYNHYDFLVSVSDRFAGNGLEHHRSSEDGVGADFFTSWNPSKSGKPGRPFRGGLFAHEFTHSWNGKFRRPADLWTPNFNVPMGDSLLWVYEGATQYWGEVLPVRSGMETPEQFRDGIAGLAGHFERGLPGLDWRNIQDTTNDEMVAHRRSRPYSSWQMGELYYAGGALIWLDVDCKIRALTHDKQSLDDFAKAFYGIDNGSFVTKTYTFDDLVAALNKVVKYDWASFLRSRLDGHKPPLDGIAASGWKLVFTNTPSKAEKRMQGRRRAGFALSIGLSVGGDGAIRDVLWNGPAFKAGVGSGETLVAVNGKAYSSDVLKAAIEEAQKSRAPIQLLLKSQGQYKTVPVPYYDGPQYAHLVRIKGAPDYLDEIVAARK
ncbi:MAG TPA: peptidase M61 [Rhodanobacteraceae bacterium]|nr:peptidase M61 [Rhodanobacteraceae bacterium]